MLHSTRAVRNQSQSTTFAVRLVPELRAFAFDSAGYLDCHARASAKRGKVCTSRVPDLVAA
eukprot:2370310-Rhodomonas_salina.4